MADKIKDNRDELSSKFMEAFRQWQDPAGYPHVRWRDVEDARMDVILHTNQLVREQVVAADDIKSRQKRPEQEPKNRIPV